MSAILLGAFLIQGLVAGPDMLIPEPKGHLALTFSFVWTIVISNIITVAICLLFINQLAKITYVRSSLVIPFVILLIYLGAFAEKNTFEDLILVLVFGLLGWVMQQLKWPRPPLILGLVLGPMVENRLFLSTGNYGLSWIFRPGVLSILAITLGGAFYPMIRRKWQRKHADKRGEPIPGGQAPSTKKGLRLSWAVIFDLVSVISFIGALWTSKRFSFRAGFFPWAAGFPILALAITQLIADILGRESRNEGSGLIAESTAKEHLPESVVNRRTAGMLGWVIAFFAAIWLFGFAVGVSLCTFFYLKFVSREKWPLAVLLTACAWGFIYGFFDCVLHVPFPPGKLFLWLKL
jgi:hypothetical protein